MGSEVLTLQFGHYSNFVGTHWWNIQELSFQYNNVSNSSSISHDVLYREGHTQKGQVTFTPRLLLVDLQGSLGSLPEQGDLYDPKPDIFKESANWYDNLVEVQAGPSEHKNKFQQDLDDVTKLQDVTKENYELEGTTKVWSDFLYGRFHPRTIEIVKEYQHCNENTPFDAFPLGQGLWKSHQFSEDFTDKIRNYVEECDNFQGFHFLTDCTNAFAGLSSSCLEYIRDEYDRKSVLLLPVIPSYFPDNDFSSEEEKNQSLINDSVRVLNMTLGFNEFSAYSSLTVPLSIGSKGWRQPGPPRIFKNLDYNHKLPYHSSAILAAALDTVTLKHRLKNSPFTLKDLSADLTQSGRKFVAASVQMPFPIHEKSDLLDCLDKWQGPLYQSITPNCEIGTSRLMQHITLRGIREDKLKKAQNIAGKQRELPAYRCSSVNEMLALYLSYSTDATASNVTVADDPLTVKNPFPQIFKNNVGCHGYINENMSDNQRVESIPLLAGLHSGFEIGEMLETLHTAARKIKIARFHQFLSGGLEKDDFEDCLDNLFTLRENYEDSYLV
ncbi:protein misato [Diabrotica undecimpunctata]|uniref:protein misato n=1 Tax=Diabrotica undecimpunctata TaxID=50387 RepID=UPI003B639B49